MTRSLSQKQLEACRILARHRWRLITDLRTTDEAINETTAAALVDSDIATFFLRADGPRGWRIKLKPAAKQLIAMQPPGEAG